MRGIKKRKRRENYRFLAPKSEAKSRKSASGRRAEKCTEKVKRLGGPKGVEAQKVGETFGRAAVSRRPRELKFT
jgi:hypothetical protein